jgi:hypothetical protein
VHRAKGPWFGARTHYEEDLVGSTTVQFVVEIDRVFSPLAHSRGVSVDRRAGTRPRLLRISLVRRCLGLHLCVCLFFCLFFCFLLLFCFLLVKFQALIPTHCNIHTTLHSSLRRCTYQFVSPN